MLTAAGPTMVSSTTGNSSDNILMFIKECRDGSKASNTAS